MGELPDPKRLEAGRTVANGNKFWLVAEGGNGKIRADRTKVGDWEQFRIVKTKCDGHFKPGDTVNIVGAGGQFVAAENGGGKELRANRSSAGEWEKFTILNTEPGINLGTMVAFRTSSGKYVSAINGGGGEVMAQGAKIDAWEKFVMIHQSVVAMSGRVMRFESWGVMTGALHGERTKIRSLADLKKEIPSLGDVVPIAEIQKRIEELVQKGELVAGEKGLSDLSTCPNEIDTDPKKCIPPMERYRPILPDIDSFIQLVWDRVIQRQKLRPIGSDKDAVDLLFNFGCRQVARRMPGYAKIKIIKRKPGVDTSGNWDDELTDKDRDAVAEALATGGAKKGAKGPGQLPAPYKPPPKEETIEVCSVTHPQLEETLKKDIRLLAKSRLDKPHKFIAEDPDPIQGTGDPMKLDFTSAELNKVAMLIKLNDGKDLNASRPVDAGKVCAAAGGSLVPDKNGYAGKACRKGKASVNFQMALIDACNKQYHPKGWAVLMPYNGPSGSVQCEVPVDIKKILIAHFARDVDIGVVGGLAHLKGETFNTITKRLTGFYTKGGKARTFAIGKDRHAKQIKISTAEAPKDLVEAAEKQNESGEKRAAREGLSKQVDQWTDAWEYTQITDHMNTNPAFKKKANVPEFYKRAEDVTVHNYWTRCENLWEICQNPALPVEREACVRCAWDAVLTKCIDGRKPGSNGLCPEVARPRPYPGGWCDDQTNAIKNGGYDRKAPIAGEKLTKKGNLGADSRSAAFSVDVVAKQVETFAIPGTNRSIDVKIPNRNDSTFFNWLLVNAMADTFCFSFTRGLTRSGADRNAAADMIGRGTATRLFLPFGSGSADQFLTSMGRRHLDALPLTPWQRCYLWTGEGNVSCEITESPKLQGRDEVWGRVKAWSEAPRASSPLLKLVMSDGQFQREVEYMLRWFEGEDAGRLAGQRNERLGWWAQRNADWSNRLADDLGFPAESNPDEIGSSAGNAVMPIIGYLLGILLNQAGISDMMKTLSTAAGLTPEQSADCEDPEYRRDVMKLAGKANNKRGCLTKVFAKNFVNVLESIIIMLGNRLVDWAVDLLNAALKGAKSALISAAGSVPFVGGVLAAAVDIAWDLIFEFGMKTLIKALVVNKLPDWLQVKTLANANFDELLDKHPLISVVAGVILQLIEAAVQYGNMGPVGVAFAEVLEVIQAALMNDYQKNKFWVRSFIYAKRALIKDGAKGDMPIGDQITKLVLSMIEGFKTSIGSKIRTDKGREAFEAAVDAVAALAKDLSMGAFKGNPVDAIVNILKQKLLPAVIPIITSFVSMPDSIREFLDALSEAMFSKDQPFSATALLISLKKLLMTAVSDNPLARTFFDKAFDGVAYVFKDLDGLAERLKNPDALAKMFIEPVRGAVMDFVNQRLGSAKAKAAVDFVKGIVNTAFDLLLDAKKRAELLGAGKPDIKAFLPKVVAFLRTYVPPWVKEMLANAGLPQLGVIADLLFAENGPLARGEAFIADLQKWFEKDGTEAFKKILGQFIDLVKAKIGAANDSVSALANAALATLQKLFTAPGEKEKLGKLNGAAVVQWIKAQLQPFIDRLFAIVESSKGAGVACMGGKPFADNLRAVVNSFLALFDKPDALKADPAKAWKGFVASVDAKLRELAKCAFSGLSGDTDVGQFVAKLTFEPVAVARLLIQILDRFWGSGPVVDLVRFLVEGAFNLFATPGKLQALLAKAACAMYADDIGPWLKKLFPLVVNIYVSEKPLIPLASKAFGLVVDLVGKLFCITGGAGGSSGGSSDWWKWLRDFFLGLWPDFNLFLKLNFDLRFPDFSWLWPAWDSLWNLSFDFFGGGKGGKWKGFTSNFDFKLFFGNLFGGFWDWLIGLFSGGGGGSGWSWEWPKWFFGGFKGWFIDWPNFSLSWGSGGSSGSGGGCGVGGVKKVLNLVASTIAKAMSEGVANIVPANYKWLVVEVAKGLQWAADNVDKLCAFAVKNKCDRHVELVRSVTKLLLGKLASNLPGTLKAVVEQAVGFADKFEFKGSAAACPN
ncbi:MAG: hypothetical protein HYY84_03765 [Deltaproteobacteria bacterium]|nr:hypothetical protein [Deltaproteobacteria bacterium]